MKPKIKGVLLDVEKNTVEKVEFEPTLENYYKMLNCDMIEIATRKIGVKNGRVFAIVCDEEGALKEDPKISAINDIGEAMLVGSLLIVGEADDDGNETSITDSDADFIIGKVQDMSTRLYPNPYKMLTQCEYCF